MLVLHCKPGSVLEITVPAADGTSRTFGVHVRGPGSCRLAFDAPRDIAIKLHRDADADGNRASPAAPEVNGSMRLGSRHAPR